MDGDKIPLVSSSSLSDNRATLTWRFVRIRLFLWLLWPLVFSAGCWLHFVNPCAFQNFFPCTSSRCSPIRPPPPPNSPAPPSAATPTERKELSPDDRKLLPSSLHSGWQLGKIAGILETRNTSFDRNETESYYLAQAASILKVEVDFLTKEKICQIGDIILADEHSWRRDTFAWILGLLTVVNILWFFGICGFACSIGPVIYYCLQPVADVILRAVILPIFSFVVSLRPLYEPVFYCASFCLILLSDCLEQGPRDWVILTALLLSAVTHGYQRDSYLFLSDHVRDWGSLAMDTNDLNLFCLSLGSGYLTLGTIPLAMESDSSFLGSLAVFCLYSSTCTFLYSSAFEYLFSSEEDSVPEDVARTLYPALISCLSLCFLYAMAHQAVGLAFMTAHGIDCFVVGLAVFGPLGFLSCGLLLSSARRGNFRHEANLTHLQNFIPYSLILASFFLYGLIFHSTVLLALRAFSISHFSWIIFRESTVLLFAVSLQAIYNLACLFAVLFAVVHSMLLCGKYFTPQSFPYVLTCLVSTVLWLSALFLHSNPSWLSDIFK